jgi:flagellar hook-associated protein 2
MASPINFSGLASGIDSQAIIDSSIASARLARVTPNQKKASELEEANTALEGLGTKLDTLRTTLQGFTSLTGGGVTKTGASSKESVVSATATNAASNGSYSVTVNSLAKNHTYSFDQTYSSSSAAMQSTLTGSEPAADRTVTFTVGTGSNIETVSVVITNGSYTISQFVSDFNNASSKAEASIVNTGTESSPVYKVVISSIYEGTDKGTIARTSLGASLTNLTPYSESAAANSSISISGIGTITRATNSIADVIPGVTLSLSSTGSATVKIAEDAAATTAKMQDFLTAYNNVVKYITENNQVSRDESGNEVKNVFGPLANTRTDDGVLQALRANLSSTTAAGGSLIRVFSDLGITTERDGTVKLDTAKLQSAVSSEPGSVSEVLKNFADSVALTGGTIDRYTRYSGLLDISLNNNKTLITDLNKRVADAEKQIQRMADAMKVRYSRLEGLMAKLQQQGSSLTGALGMK